MVVVRRLQEAVAAADGTGVTPSSTRPAPAPEATLSRVEGMFRLLAAGVTKIALLLAEREGRIRMATGALWQRLDIVPDALSGLPVHGSIVPEVAAALDAALAGEISRMVVPLNHEYRVTVVPIRSDEEVVAGALALAAVEGDELAAERAAAAELTRRLAQQSAVAQLGDLALQWPELDELM